MPPQRTHPSLSPSISTKSSNGSKSSRSLDSNKEETPLIRSSSPDDGFGNKKQEWKGDEEDCGWGFSFEDCEGLKIYADEARERGDSREAFSAYSVCLRAIPYEANFWISRAILALEMKMYSRSLNDSQTAALCLKKSNQVSHSLLSESNSTRASTSLTTSKSRSKSKSKSPMTGLNKLEELFKKDQKKLLANALYLKSLSRFHLGDFIRAKESIVEAENQLQSCLKGSNNTSKSEIKDTDNFGQDLMEKIKAMKNNLTSFKFENDFEYFKWLQSQELSVMIKDETSTSSNNNLVASAWFDSKDELEDSLEEMAGFWSKKLNRNFEKDLNIKEEFEGNEYEMKTLDYHEVEMEDLEG